jgi:hypothetical protein
MLQSFNMLVTLVLIQFIFSCNNNSATSSASNTILKDQDNMTVSTEVTDPEDKDDISVSPESTGQATESTGETTAEQVNGTAVNQPAQIRFMEGQFFTYALAPGWQVTEDGQFAVVAIAQDQKAVTIMVGNTGMPANYSPGQYIYERLSAAGYQQLNLGQPRQAKPIQGCSIAYEFDYRYLVNGVACRGIARCHMAPSYDMQTMIMTAAASVETQWKNYAGWLPDVAALAQAKDGRAFGARGIMEQNIRNSTAYAEAARNYREWSAKNWQAVTDDRNKSVDAQNEQFRENIGAVQTYINPYDPGKTIELSTQYKYYWIDQQGKTWGTNDPSANPNTGSTTKWVKMNKKNN